ncbi:MAG TPA: HisA/HisF-related TIM barrel protein [Anaerohalosphaeraceae bacterium]|nr:HisA/HisF-related TIM barrel protein [Anaerohalosphaeraceae bacterium]
MAKQVRIMPCLDMQNGRVVKGVHFVDIQDAGDPVSCAKAYCAAGADELALLDIDATVENRRTMLTVVKDVAQAVAIPFTVGGGISDMASAVAVIEAGADKISVSSAAFRNPNLIPELIKELGAEKITVAIDVDRNPSMQSGYEVYIDGGRTAAGVDAVEWAKKVDGFGVPVILPTSRAAGAS